MLLVIETCARFEILFDSFPKSKVNVPLLEKTPDLHFVLFLTWDIFEKDRYTCDQSMIVQFQQTTDENYPATDTTRIL